MKNARAFIGKQKVRLLLSAVLALGLLAVLPLSAADPCTDCKSKCNTQYCRDKANCQQIPAGQAREACKYAAENVRVQCYIMCNTDGYCNDGDVEDPPPCFVSGRADTCIRTP